jgi:hypothetical protein
LLDMQKVMARQDPKVLEIDVRDMIDDQFVRQLDESGDTDRLCTNVKSGGLG